MNGNGNVVAVGERSDENDTGKTTIYEYNGTEWEQKGVSIVGENAGDDSGTSVSLNSAGNIVAIGEIFASPESKENAGQTRIFQYIVDNWVQIGKIEGENEEDQSGVSVSLNSAGNIVAIGEWQVFIVGVGTFTGQTRMFEYIDINNWVEIGRIPGQYLQGYFGVSVSLNKNETSPDNDGTIVAIGSDFVNNKTGQTLIYQYDNGNWNQIGNPIIGKKSGEQSGISVQLDKNGERVVVSSLFENNLEGKGSTSVYKYDDEKWIQIGNTINSKYESEDNLYIEISSINSTGDIIAISESEKGENKPVARMFQYDGDGDDWVQLGSDIPSIINPTTVIQFNTVSLNNTGCRVAIAESAYSVNGNLRVFEYKNETCKNTNIESRLQEILFGDNSDDEFTTTSTDFTTTTD